MKDQIDLKKLEQRSWRELNQDGLMDIMMGFMLILLSVGAANPGITGIWVVFFIFSASALERIRKRVTYPRIGYVKLVEEDPKETLRGIGLYFVIVLAAMALVLAIVSGELSWDMLRRWAPALGGFLISGAMIYSASKSGSMRYYVFLALAIGLGVAISIANLEDYEGLTLYLFSLGTFILVWGSVMMLRFTRKYPLPANAGNNAPR